VHRQPEMVKENLWNLLQERAAHPKNVPVTSEARSRTWPPPPPDKKIPLRPNRMASRIDSVKTNAPTPSHPSPHPSPR
jgi:hypothetical protein